MRESLHEPHHATDCAPEWIYRDCPVCWSARCSTFFVGRSLKLDRPRRTGCAKAGRVRSANVRIWTALWVEAAVVVVSGRVNREPHRCDDAAEVTSTGMPSIASDATEAVQTARCRARDGGPAAGCACRPRPRRRLRLRRPGVPRGSAAALRGEGVGRSPAALAVAGLRRRVVCWRGLLRRAAQCTRGTWACP
jgi:hypothetical protein